MFLPVNDALLDTREEPDDELRRLRLQYRNRLEFAVGRTCSVDWQVAEGARRASEVWTAWLPVCETPQTAAEEIGTALLDMRKLETADAAELRAGLEPIVESYAAWLDAEEERARELPEHLRSEGLTRSPMRGGCSASSRRAWSSCWLTRRRCVASGS
ncbi:hypothetical protein ACFQ2B_08125 [Streptomyces stramineus]